jgi:beta-glucosidase
VGTPRWVALALAAAVIAGVAASSTSFVARGATTPPWMRSGLPPAQRADLLLAAMTTPEKIAMLHGVGWTTAGSGAYAGRIPANARLGIPEIRLQDGPAGVGNGFTGVTAFPAPLARAASWNVDTERAVASAIGAEQAAKGVDVALGPTVNLARVPQWGRTHESFGEDPTLTSAMAVASVAGIQSQGVLAVVKHFAAYNQETSRMTGSAGVSERALQELYLPAFRAAVQRGGAAGVMTAYNQVNGTWASENRSLLETLKTSWGFGGFVVSDWGGVHSTEAAANAGLDVEMPDGDWFGKSLAGAVAAGGVSQARLDDMTRRVLTQLFRFGLFDRARRGDATTPASTPEHRAVARAAETDGTVLLKNSGGVLPLARPRSIAVIGRPGTDPAAVGCGSAHVDGGPLVSPAAGLAARAGAGVVRTEPGDDRTRAAAAARAADVAVVVVRDGGCEGVDRPDLALPDGQDALVDAVAAANPRTVVVLQTQGPVLMPWIGRVAAVVEMWYGGEQGGNALASVLFGDVDPGGRLPMTFPADAWQVPAATPLQYPGVDGRAMYSEDLDIGYRHYDRAGFVPLFAFGYGQSYTTFAYRDLQLSAAPGGHVVATFVVRNTGTRAGTDVAQLYISHPALDGEPPRVLAGFRKVALAPGRETTVRIDVDPASLAHWDSMSHSWSTTTGRYGVSVGRSSAELPLTGTIDVGG